MNVSMVKAIINAKSDELFFGLPAEQTVWMSHSDKVKFQTDLK